MWTFGNILNLCSLSDSFSLRTLQLLVMNLISYIKLFFWGDYFSKGNINCSSVFLLADKSALLHFLPALFERIRVAINLVSNVKIILTWKDASNLVQNEARLFTTSSQHSKWINFVKKKDRFLLKVTENLCFPFFIFKFTD